MKDEELIHGCCNDDRNAQEMLYKKYYTDFLKICLRYCTNEQDAAFILNEAFYKIFTKMHQYRNDGNLHAWMRKIVVNTSLDFVRKMIAGRKTIAFETHHEAIPEEEQSSFRIDMKHMLRQIQKLPDTHRLVLNLFVFEGRTHSEISKTLNISEGTSAWYLSKSRQLLKDMLSHEHKKMKNE